MGTLMATYAIALMALAAYTAWLRVAAKRLARRIERMDAHFEPRSSRASSFRAKAENAA